MTSRGLIAVFDYGSRVATSYRRAKSLEPKPLVKKNKLDKTPLEGHEKSSAIEKRSELAEAEGENGLSLKLVSGKWAQTVLKGPNLSQEGQIYITFY